jgi:hypothetical protein
MDSNDLTAAHHGVDRDGRETRTSTPREQRSPTRT